MREHFDAAMDFVFKWEGEKFVNNPADLGGPTKYGISQKYNPDIDVKALTKDQAKSIYRERYWDKIGGDKLPWPDCLVHMDTAVLFGKDDVDRWKSHDWVSFIFQRMLKHLRRVKRNPMQTVFLVGWLNRCIDLYWTAKKEVK